MVWNGQNFLGMRIIGELVCFKLKMDGGLIVLPSMSHKKKKSLEALVNKKLTLADQNIKEFLYDGNSDG